MTEILARYAKKEREERVASDGLGLVRPAGGGVCAADWKAPGGDDGEEYQAV